MSQALQGLQNHRTVPIPYLVIRCPTNSTTVGEIFKIFYHIDNMSGIVDIAPLF